jgi:hypothetical protein
MDSGDFGDVDDGDSMDDLLWTLDENLTTNLVKMRWTLAVEDGDDPKDLDWLPDYKDHKIEKITRKSGI